MCSVAGCERPVRTRGYCNAHYQRWWTYGDPLGSAPRRTLWDRFWEKVDKTGDCWLWTAGTTIYGYGVIGVGPHKVGHAHRISYEWAYGRIPNGLHVCHRCDVPACVRPAHLFLGTAQDNLADMARKGRSAHGSKNPNARLTEAGVAEIRRRYAAGGVLQRELADEFGVSRSTVTTICQGKRWTRA